MLDLGGMEITLILMLAIVVLGPTKLPQVARTLGLWMGRLRRMYNNFKLELDREVGMDDVRRQLHNEQIMSEMKDLEKETKSILHDVKTHVNEGVSNPVDSSKVNTSETTSSVPDQAKSG